MPKITLPHRPHPGQEQVKGEQRRYNVVCCGRRWGKTAWGIDRVVRVAAGGKRAGWFAPSYKYTQEAWRTLTQVLKPVIVKENAAEKRIETTSGGTVEVWSLSNDRDAGRSRRYDLAVIDEAAKIHTLKHAWPEAIRPTLADTGGGAWFLSTPKGRNYFHDLYQRAAKDDAWASWQMPTSTNPHIQPEEIKALRHELPARVFAQEVEAKFILDHEGALWSRDQIHDRRAEKAPSLKRIVVGVDPSGGGDAIGIVACGLGVDGRGYVLSDRTTTGSPHAWGSAVVGCYRQTEADRVVAERNFGGDMVESTLRTVDAQLPVTMVTASRGKQQRAEPVAALYEQGKVSHVGTHATLEEEMATWDPTDSRADSPNRVDALVWGLTDLMLTNSTPTMAFA